MRKYLKKVLRSGLKLKKLVKFCIRKDGRIA